MTTAAVTRTCCVCGCLLPLGSSDETCEDCREDERDDDDAAPDDNDEQD